MKAFQLIKDSMGGGSGPMQIVFTELRSAQIWAEDNKEEWTGYAIKEVEVREFTSDEGAVGKQLVEIRRISARDLIRARALEKLTDEERAVIGLPNSVVSGSIPPIKENNNEP